MKNKFDLQKIFENSKLLPCIVQNYNTDKVLMLGYVSFESMQKTLATKFAWFYSRSRQNLWQKGETSGNFQKIKEIYLDCDQDTFLFKVEQVNNITCHTGQSSCFFYQII
jgi:phosphoribosyl-AMP cyclohydrolase